MLYFAYGSNLHQEQMKRRCSGCKYLKKYILQDYRLTFRSELCVADIEYKKGSSVQGALYEITDKDDIFISNECTRSMMLSLLNKEVPYNIEIINKTFLIFIKKYSLNMREGM